MNYVIKSLKENIYVNIILILIFVIAFIKMDYHHIKRYMDGFRYPEVRSQITIVINIYPKTNFFEYRALASFDKIIKDNFGNDKGVDIKNKKDQTVLYAYVSTEDSEMELEDLSLKVKQVMKKYDKLLKSDLKKVYLKNYELFFNEPLSNTHYNNIFLKREFPSFDKFVRINYDFITTNYLKLGQTKKILLLKLIIFDFIFALIAAVLFCLCISIIKKDISEIKN
tara:strand:- start:570 stop:1244 length:675 start_codon:yes stop_codon:yes gene_type:complete